MIALYRKGALGVLGRVLVRESLHSLWVCLVVVLGCRGFSVDIHSSEVFVDIGSVVHYIYHI